MNIEKVNEQLGFFGGGILDQPDPKDVTLEGDPGETIENPFEEQNLL